MKYTCLKADNIEVILPVLLVYRNTPQRYLIKASRTIDRVAEIMYSFKL